MILRKLVLNNSNQVGLYSNGIHCQSEYSKLIRVCCVIISFHISYNLIGLSNSTLLSSVVKKSALNNRSYNRFFLEVTIRV